MKMQPKKR